VRNLHKQAERKGWIQALKQAREAKERALSQSVAKTSETIASLADSFKFTTMKGVKMAAESFFAKAPTPENWQEMKLATDIAAKVGGFGQDSGALVQVLFTGGETCSDDGDAIEVEGEIVGSDLE
jgi:hypothetical protein